MTWDRNRHSKKLFLKSKFQSKFKFLFFSQNPSFFHIVRYPGYSPLMNMVRTPVCAMTRTPLSGTRVTEICFCCIWKQTDPDNSYPLIYILTQSAHVCQHTTPDRFQYSTFSDDLLNFRRGQHTSTICATRRRPRDQARVITRIHLSTVPHRMRTEDIPRPVILRFTGRPPRLLGCTLLHLYFF